MSFGQLESRKKIIRFLRELKAWASFETKRVKEADCGRNGVFGAKRVGSSALGVAGQLGKGRRLGWESARVVLA